MMGKGRKDNLYTKNTIREELIMENEHLVEINVLQEDIDRYRKRKEVYHGYIEHCQSVIEDRQSILNNEYANRNIVAPELIERLENEINRAGNVASKYEACITLINKIIDAQENLLMLFADEED